MSDFFLDVYTFVASQVGLVAVGYIIRGAGPLVSRWLNKNSEPEVIAFGFGESRIVDSGVVDGSEGADDEEETENGE